MACSGLKTVIKLWAKMKVFDCSTVCDRKRFGEEIYKYPKKSLDIISSTGVR